MDFNKIPWTTNELIDYAALALAAIMVTAFPVVYALTASLRDRLALVIIFSTSATALVFVTAAVLWPLEHAGVVISDQVGHWLARGLYLTVGLGKLLLLWSLLHERRTRDPRA